MTVSNTLTEREAKTVGDALVYESAKAPIETLADTVV